MYKAKDFVDSFVLGDKTYHYYSIEKASALYSSKVLTNIPVCLKILLENILRHSGSSTVNDNAIASMSEWAKFKSSDAEIAFHPSRVLMQDFTGVPAVVDLAAMRDAVARAGSDPELINPQCRVDLVVDHSVSVDKYGGHNSFEQNVDLEMQRNAERYKFLKWGQQVLKNFRVVPPGSGICHQVNLEKLAEVVWADEADDKTFVYPDTLVGTDSHTTMINALGVLGWGVGGIEAEAAMLGQSISMLIPEVIGVKLEGSLALGVTATDLVLTITNILRQHGVVGSFLEFFGPGATALSLEERATIANMSPEFGATCAFFPVDKETCRYMLATTRDQEQVELVEAYARAQGIWSENNLTDALYTDIVRIDLASVRPCVAGPKRPQDKALLQQLPELTSSLLTNIEFKHNPTEYYYTANRELTHGDVVIAAITSCTNTSNPGILIAAALLAKKAIESGLQTKSWVKTSLAPGSRVVIAYLEKLGLLTYLEQLGFYLVGYGCTTCIGNSGPLDSEITNAIVEQNLVVSAVLSGNRNFEGRVHPLTKANWLASPPLVVAYALAGTTMLDITAQPLGEGSNGALIYLKDLWPQQEEINKYLRKINEELFLAEYSNLFTGDNNWRDIAVTSNATYAWDKDSSYIQLPNFFNDQSSKQISDINQAAILAILGDSITTDHISPAGAIASGTPAADYLEKLGINSVDFNSYGSRRGNHFVMTRGTFANIRLRNEMASGYEGGYTRHYSDNEITSIFACAMRYKAEDRSAIVIAGSEYGTGSSRDWAAKGTYLLGVKAVIAESFERIHRSNLIGMGVLPLEFMPGEGRFTWQLTGSELIDIAGIAELNSTNAMLTVTISRPDNSKLSTQVRCRIDTLNELNYYRKGGILHYVLANLVN